MSKWSALPFDGAGMAFGSPHDIRTVTKVWGRAGGVEGEGWRGRPSTGVVLYLHRCYYPGGLFLKDEAVKVCCWPTRETTTQRPVQDLDRFPSCVHM